MHDDIESTAAASFDAARFREVLGHFCTGVTVVTSLDGDGPAGFTAQSFVSLSLDPPLVAVCPASGSATLPRIRAAGTFCVNVLTDDQEAVSRTFAGRGIDKFEGIGWRPAPSGAPVLDDVLAWVDCSVEVEHVVGDHVLVVGRVRDLGTGDGRPLLFFRGGYGSLSQ